MPVNTIVTLAEVQQRMDGLAVESQANVLTQLITNATAAIGRFCGRIGHQGNLFFRQADLVEKRDGVGDILMLSCWPIESVSEVVVAGPDRDFANGTIMVEDEDFLVEPERGFLRNRWMKWPSRGRLVQVKYTGGFVHPDDEPSATQYPIPDDLREACIQQVIFWYNQRTNYGTRGLSLADGSVQYLETKELLPAVQQMLNNPQFRREGI